MTRFPMARKGTNGIARFSYPMVSSGEEDSNGGEGGGQQNRGHTVHTVNKSHDSSQLDIPPPTPVPSLETRAAVRRDTKAGRRPCKEEPGYRNHLPV